MSGSFRSCAVAIVSLAASLTASAADLRVPLASGGAMILPAPAGWKAVKQAGAVPTIVLVPDAGDFQVVVSPLVTSAGVTVANADSLRRLVTSSAHQAQARTVETSVTIQDLRGPAVQGSFYSATERAPNPGEFKYITVGAMMVTGVPVTFTILCNATPQAVRESALKMLQATKREP